VQYGDYALWQRGWLQGEVLEEQVEYWRKQLAGVEPLGIEWDYGMVGEEGGERRKRGGVEKWELSEELTQGLRQLSRREGVTMFMTLVAGWQVVLWRWSGREDVAVGRPI